MRGVGRHRGPATGLPAAALTPTLGLDARGRRLRAALAAVLVEADTPEKRLMRGWLDSWTGLGLVVNWMTHQGGDLQLTAYAARELLDRVTNASQRRSVDARRTRT